MGDGKIYRITVGDGGVYTLSPYTPPQPSPETPPEGRGGSFAEEMRAYHSHHYDSMEISGFVCRYILFVLYVVTYLSC